MGRYRLVIPPHVADVIRSLHPDLKRSVRNALRALGDDPSAGSPLRRELEGLWKFRVRRGGRRGSPPDDLRGAVRRAAPPRRDEAGKWRKPVTVIGNSLYEIC